MWCEAILWNLADRPDSDERVVDYVDVQWHELRNVYRGCSAAGEAVHVLLSREKRLRGGDVVGEGARGIIVVRVVPCEVIVARPRNSQEAAVLAMELGNLHLAAQISEGQIIFVEDGPAMKVLEDLHIDWVRQTRVFEPTPMSCAPAIRTSRQMHLIRNSG